MHFLKVSLLHPTGNTNVRAVISALANAELLQEFDTTIAIDSNALWLNILPAVIRRELLRRTFPVPFKQIHKNVLLEAARMILPKLGLKGIVKRETGWASVDAVYKNLDYAVARRVLKMAPVKRPHAIYAYEDGALNIFTQSKELGLKCIYDLPIAYWETGRKLMKEEAERLPMWAGTLGGGINDSPEKLDRKTRELELSDMVVVSSRFVMDSLPNSAKSKKVVVSPFGTPFINKDDFLLVNKTKNADRPLRIMFAGSMGQRKGLGDLFTAVKLLNSPNIELVVMGTLLAPMDFYRQQLPDFTYESGRSHAEVLKLMRTCDIFCLPSIVEGRALVMQEAMSQGLPLIITPNTGGEDLIIDGVTGFLVPIRSPESIAKKLSWFLENRSKIPEMGKMAQQHAQKYTWDNYGKKIVESIKDLLST